MPDTRPVIYTVGIGNAPQHISMQARDILATVDIVAGHYGFLELARQHINPKAKIIDDREARNRSPSFACYQQLRVSAVVAEALRGQSVAVLSGGDTGIWGMAAVFLEARQVYENAFAVEVIPGIPALVTIAAKLGAPLQNGYTVIAIGDEDTPFAVIEQRLKGAALGGGVIVLHKLILENLNYPRYYPPDKYPELFPPREKTIYRWQRTYDILREHIPPERLLAIVTDACDQTAHYSTTPELLGSDDRKERIVIAAFQDFLALAHTFRFFTTVIIGDAITQRCGERVITPQWHYQWKYDREMMNDLAGLPYMKEQNAFFGRIGKEGGDLHREPGVKHE